MQTVTNVSAGKPRVGGAMYVAPLGTELPTDAVSPLSSAFKSLGYISEDGLTNDNTKETEEVKAWGGDTVYTPLSEVTDTWQFTLIESLNVDVLKFIYGEENVTGDLTSGISIRSNATENVSHVAVFDMIMREGALKRVVIPVATISETGEIVYNDTDPVGYETTISGLPYTDGDTHKEYIQMPESQSE